MLLRVSDSILILSPDLASQIAAGEVVERPASVAKELIENALDAGASRISVEIEGGGLQRLLICDNGHGIREKELALAIRRHATSKLRQFSELEDLLTYGFRGEALPSIASVSRLKIHSRHKSTQSGYALNAEGTTEASPEPVGHPIGTTIDVCDLFFNVPARRKFLRSANTESGHVSEILLDAALCRPDVSFQLKRDGRLTRKYPQSDNRKQRVQQVLGEADLIHLEAKKGPLQIEALLCEPQQARRGTQGLRWVINGRPVKDRALSGSVAHAFGQRLEKGFYPKGVIYLDLPGHLIDINVHPQKTEIRFSNLRAISEAIHGLFQKEVDQAWPVTSEKTIQPLSNTAPDRNQFKGAEPKKGAPFQRTADIKAHYLKEHSPPPSGQRYAREEFQASRNAVSPGLGRVQSPQSSPVQQAAKAEPIANLQAELTKRAPKMRQEKSFRNLRFRYQAKSRYLVCENDEGLFLLDQHVASELVLFHRIMQALQHDGLPAQRLLFPQSLEVSSKHRTLLDHLLLNQLGIDLRLRDESDVHSLASLHAMPEALKSIPSELVIKLIFEWLGSQNAPRPFAELNAEQKYSSYITLAAQLSCKAALQDEAGLGQDEANALLRELTHLDIEAPVRHKKLITLFVSWPELSRKAGEL